MIISIINPVLDTYIFTAILVVALLVSIRREKTNDFFSVKVTQELKGLAILAVVFSHISYFLVSDNRFLFPLSIAAGVGINLFLFLSGYGLVISAMSKPRSIIQFYQQRLAKLYIPFWLVLAVFIGLDFFLLKITYSWSVIVRSFIGWFPHADLYTDINSPFWYFSFIAFYYLFFPLVFLKKAPWLSALIIYFATYFVVNSQPSWLINVQGLYEVHLLAFPIGMIVANLFFKWKVFKNFFARLKKIHPAFYFPLVIALLAVIGYTAYHSGVGQGAAIEEHTSLITMAAIIVLFLIKKFEIKLLYIFGFFSYEIYLLHWPIIYRYDIFFKYFPSWLALSLYLVLFIGLGWILQKISSLIMRKPRASIGEVVKIPSVAQQRSLKPNV